MTDVIRLEIQIDDKGTPVIRTVAQGIEDLTQGSVKLADAQKSGQQASTGFGIALGGISAAVVAVNQGFDLAQRIMGQVQGVVSFLKDDYVNLGVQVRNLTFVTGESAQQMSGLLSAAKMMDVGSEGLTKALFILSREVDTGGVNLAKMGISLRDQQGQMKPLSQLLFEVADKTKNYGSIAEASTELTRAFGRGVLELLPMLRGGSDEIQRMMEVSKQLGTQIGGKDLDAIQRYRDAIERHNQSWLGFKIEIMPGLLNLFTAIEEKALSLSRVLNALWRPAKAGLVDPAEMERLWGAVDPTGRLRASMPDRGSSDVGAWRLGAAGARVSGVSVPQGPTDAERIFGLQMQQRQQQSLGQWYASGAATLSTGAGWMGTTDAQIAALRQAAGSSISGLDILEIQDPRTAQTVADEKVRIQADLAAKIEAINRQARQRTFESTTKDQDRLKDEYSILGGTGDPAADQANLEHYLGVAFTTENDFQKRVREVRAAGAAFDDTLNQQRVEDFTVSDAEIAEAQLAGSIRDRQRVVDDLRVWKDARDQRVTQDKAALETEFYATGDYFDKIKLGLEYYANDYRSPNQRILEMTKELYQDMSRAASDLYFDVLTGQLDKLSDIWKNAWHSMARYMSDELAKSTMSWLFGGGSGGSGGSSGGGTGGLLGLGGKALDVADAVASGTTSAGSGILSMLPGGTLIDKLTGGAISGYLNSLFGPSAESLASFDAALLSMGGDTLATTAGGAGLSSLSGLLGSMAPFIAPIASFGAAGFMSYQDYAAKDQIARQMNDQLNAMKNDPAFIAQYSATLEGLAGSGATTMPSWSSLTGIPGTDRAGYDMAHYLMNQGMLPNFSAWSSQFDIPPQTDFAGGDSGRAGGGPIWPGFRGTVGERGIEDIYIGPGGYGMVTPRQGGTDTGSGGGDIHIHIHGDIYGAGGLQEAGRKIALALRAYAPSFTGSLVPAGS